MIINPGYSQEEEKESGVGRSMEGQTVEPTQGTPVTAGVGAEVFNDYRERQFGTDEGYELVKPVKGNIASGTRAHAEGSASTASGANSHAEGYGTTASGSASHAEGGGYTGDYESSKATAYAAHAEGCSTTASGKYSHAEGSLTKAEGESAHAEGREAIASGWYSHAEGTGTASGYTSHAEGSGTASGYNSHAEGFGTVASGQGSHAEGNWCKALGFSAHASGTSTIANDYQMVVGKFNVSTGGIAYDDGNYFVVGKGSAEESRANSFRVQSRGVYASGDYNSTGADYAELFEWLDGNPDKADRCGRFVTLDGEKIRLAGPEDDYILGIVSGNPSVVGDVHDDQWAGMYLYDVFGRPLWEDVEVPDMLGHDGEVIIPAHMEHRQKLNPDYDNTQPYQPRSQRPEWDAVGMLGKLVAVDDGTCQVNGWCTVGEGGIATASNERTRFRVMARLDEFHVRVLIL